MVTRRPNVSTRAPLADTRDNFVKKLLAERQTDHDSKTARLKALRLAKEAHDESLAPAVAPAKKRKARKAAKKS